MTTYKPTFRDKAFLATRHARIQKTEVAISESQWERLSSVCGEKLTKENNKWLIQSATNFIVSMKLMQDNEKTLRLKMQATLKGLIKLPDEEIEDAYHHCDHLTQRAMNDAIIVGEVRACSNYEDCFKPLRLTPYMPPACYRQAAIVALYYQEKMAKTPSVYPYDLEAFHRFLDLWIVLGQGNFSIWSNSEHETASPLVMYFCVIYEIIDNKESSYSTMAKRLRKYQKALFDLQWPCDLFKIDKMPGGKLEIIVTPKWGKNAHP